MGQDISLNVSPAAPSGSKLASVITFALIPSRGAASIRPDGNAENM